MPPTMQIKRGTAAALASVNPTPLVGELVWDSTNNTLRVGNGSAAYSSLSIVSATPTSHSHGNITNAGAIGSTANLPIITTTSGVLTTGTFSTTAGTFCEGNDSRLSDTRTPTDGSVTTAKLANDAVTYAKIQNVSATDRLLGRSSAGSGDVEEITCTAFGRSLIDDADAAAARSTLSVQPTASPAFTGAATVTNDGNVVPLTVTNTGTANSFVVNDASGDTSPFVIDASGNVGVGASPSQRLHIHEASANDCYARWTNTDTGTSSGLLIGLNGNEQGIIRVEPNKSLFLGANNTDHIQLTGGGQLLVTTGSASAPGVAFSGDTDTGIAQLSAAGANTLSICTNSAERVRVDASGNVGIGAAPSDRFHVEQSSGIATIILKSAASVAARINFQTTTDGNGYINYDTGAWKFFTNNAGAATERVQIASDGKLYAFNTYGTTVGATNRDLFIDSGGLIGYVSSIRASKTNIAAIDDVSWLRDLTPVSFHYRKRNKDGTYSDEADGTLDYGLIAEEVEPVAPEMCFYDFVDGEPQLRGVHYSKLITPMLRYIQQLEARIAALEERVNA